MMFVHKKKDFLDAKMVAEQLDTPIQKIDFIEQYWEFSNTPE